MRKLIKAARISYKNEARKDGIRHIRQTKMCSECDPLNCICKDNQRGSKMIDLLCKLNLY